MKRLSLLIVLLATLLQVPAAQQNKTALPGSIALIPYLSESYGQQVDRVIIDKLQQIAIQKGMAGSGFDDRFIITARLIVIDEQQTTTMPSKTALRLSVGIYIGDGIDGTLYSSWQTELRGIGDNGTKARLAALRKLNTGDNSLQQAVELGRQRIIGYYDSQSSSIIERAKALAASTMYDQAILALLSIPTGCKDYETAQSLIAQYGFPALENANSELLLKASAAWSGSPNSSGAQRARSLLGQINYPTTDQQLKAQQLCSEMSKTLQQQANQQWSLLMQESKQWHERQIARIESDRDQRVAAILGAAQVEAAWASRPQVHYHVNWW